MFGMQITAIATRPIAFPTIIIPNAGDLNGFVCMAAGWNLQVNVGLTLGVDLDNPVRAPKSATNLAAKLVDTRSHCRQTLLEFEHDDEFSFMLASVPRTR
jgi:hypothetical protein